MNTSDLALSKQHVRFQAGLRHEIRKIVEQYGCQRALVLSTPEQSGTALDLAESLGPRAVSVFSKARMHTPVDVTREALDHAHSVQADCLVAVGGGSTTGLSKALAIHTDLPQFVIPTTYAGSEATPILGQTEGGIKTTLRDPRILPRVVLYDPELVVSLPRDLSVTSGLNAMAHAAEALYAKDRTKASTKLATEGLQHFASSLPDVIADPTDLNARENTLRGAWACGTVLGNVGMALHHKLCHTLGGSFDLPHAQTHAVILPHAIAYNAFAVSELLEPVVSSLGGDNAGLSLWNFAHSLGAPLSLQAIGMAKDDIETAARIALKNPYWNPREITYEGILQLLHMAWVGSAPA